MVRHLLTCTFQVPQHIESYFHLESLIGFPTVDCILGAGEGSAKL